MEKTKIHLSPDELELMGNGRWILTKNHIIEKISQGFAALSGEMQREVLKLHPLLAGNTGRAIPKIARGEKYEGLPYVMLDYPGIFEKEHILAVRTFYWWGNFCSITLHLKGKYKDAAVENIFANRQHFYEKNFYISVSGQEWNHDLNSLHYTPICKIHEDDLNQKLVSDKFVKFSGKVGLGQWNEMEETLLNYFIVLIKAVKF